MIEHDVSWREDGFVEAQWGNRYLRGWARSRRSLLDVLAGWEAPADVIQLASAMGDHTVRRTLTTIRDTRLPEARARDLLEHSSAERDLVLVRLDRLRATLVPESVESYLEEQAQRLQTEFPQVRALTYPFVDGVHQQETYCRAYDWVDPSVILRTIEGAETWGRFTRRQDMPAKLTFRLLEAEHPGIWLRKFTDVEEPVHLTRYVGPNGPVYEVETNGSHRVHLARMLGLPRILAEVIHVPLPRSVACPPGYAELVEDMPRQAQARDELRRLWPALVAQRLVSGAVQPGPDPLLQLTEQPAAPWLLAPAGIASATMAAYDRAYPGSAARLGIPDEALRGPSAWTRWLLDERRAADPLSSPDLDGSPYATGWAGPSGLLRTS